MVLADLEMREVIPHLKVQLAAQAAEIIPVAAEAVLLKVEQTDPGHKMVALVETEQQIQFQDLQLLTLAAEGAEVIALVLLQVVLEAAAKAVIEVMVLTKGGLMDLAAAEAAVQVVHL